MGLNDGLHLLSDGALCKLILRIDGVDIINESKYVFVLKYKCSLFVSSLCGN